MADQRSDLPLVDRLWLAEQCGPFTCGCSEVEDHQVITAAAAAGLPRAPR